MVPQLRIMKGIQGKLFVSFLLVMMLPTTLIGIGSYWVSTSTVQEQARQSFEENISFLATGIDRDMRRVEQLADFIYANESIGKLLLFQQQEGADYFFASKRADQELDNYLLSSDLYPYIDALSVIGLKKGTVYMGVGNGNTKWDKILGEPWVNQAMYGNGKIMWLGIQNTFSPYKKEKVVTVVRGLKDDRYRSNIGLLVISLKLSFFNARFSTANGGSSSTISIVDHNRKIVYHTDASQIGGMTNIYPEGTPETVMGTYKEADNAGGKSLVAYCRIHELNWWIVQSQPLKQLFRKNDTIFTVTLYVFLCSLLLACIVWYFVSSGIVMPIRRLTSAIGRGKGTVGLNKVPVRNEDEIGVLTSAYNRMTERIEKLVEDVIEEQNQKKDAEYAALQAQINPHFLYNTLNSIRWMAIIQGAGNIKIAVETLGRLLRNTVKRTGEPIPLTQEIANVQDFIAILQLRYHDRFAVAYEILPGAETSACLPFIVQPIVENAVFHGIEPKDGKGTIVIRAEIDSDESLVLTVADDGVGMPAPVASALLTKSSTGAQGFTGIGLKNINDRIQLTFGMDYGLTVRSLEGLGTEIIVRMPNIRMPLKKVEEG